MQVNVPIGPVDIVILVILGLMMIGGVKIVIGFFHEGTHELKKSTYNGKGAIKMTLAIDGMQCGHCEANINETIRKNFDVNKVSSNHTKGEAVVIAPHDIKTEALQHAIEESGYSLIDVARENYKGKLKLS